MLRPLHHWKNPLPLILTALAACMLVPLWAGMSRAAEQPTLPAQTVTPAPVPVAPAAPVVPAPIPGQEIKTPELPHKFENDPKLVANALEKLIEEAVKRNPELAATREALEAARARIPQAGMPEDPMVGFRMKDLPTTFSMTRENATEKQAEFAQRYPFPGKLTLRQKIAGRQAAQSREQTHAELVSLVTQVRAAFADVFVVDKDIAVALERQRRLRDFVDIATSKYKVGSGLQQDVLNADVALARLDSELIALARKRRSREIQLGVLLDRDSVRVEPLGVLPVVGLKHSPAELEQLAIEANPLVREREAAVQRNKLAVKLARMAPLPDFAFSAAYGARVDHPPPAPVSALNRPDLLTAEVMMTVPLFYPWKQRMMLAETEANLRRSRSKLAAARRAAVDELHDLLVRLTQHEQVAASFRDEVIPVARAAVSASLSGYQVNRVDFLTVLAAQDNLDNYQADYWRNEADRFRDLAKIDEVTGAVLVEDGWSK